MLSDIVNILKNVRNKLNLNGRKRVFEDNKKLNSNDLLEPQDPEEFTRNFLINKILFNVLNLKLLGTNVKFKLIKETRKVDYAIKIPNYSVLIEAKPINSNLYEKDPDGAVNQILGLFRVAEAKEKYEFGIATDGIKWVFISNKGMIIDELNIKNNFEKIKEILIGKKDVSPERIEEEITKKFYDWYNALLHGGKYKDHENKIKEISTKDCLIENIISVSNLEDREQIAQTLMDRLIFIKFLQSKKIISHDILDYLSKLDENILNAVLRQLFFHVFNKKKSERYDVYPKFKDIPYLNGSLFLWTEAEERNSDYKVRSFILKEIIKFLDSFKFGHEENTGEHQILDPKILGFIFERAMTAQDRKGTGAYYTPKSITRYISEHTIHPVIIRKVNEFLKERGYKESELLKNIEDVYRLRESTLGEIFAKIISNLKICDNACGSGAFLLAAGDVLLEIHKRIDMELRLENSEIGMRKIILKYNLYGLTLTPKLLKLLN